MPNTLLLIFFTVSVFLNLYLLWNAKKPKPETTVDARELLHYLTRGGAVVKIEILDPQSLLVYRGN